MVLGFPCWRVIRQSPRISDTVRKCHQVASGHKTSVMDVMKTAHIVVELILTIDVPNDPFMSLVFHM